MLPREIVVLGAGVSGLTTALTLQERGLRVRIVAREVSPHTTSDVPPAFWHPYKIEGSERALEWARESYLRLSALAADPSTGVVLREGDELFAEPAPDPWWRDAVRGGLRRLLPAELPAGRVDGWRYRAPIAEVPVYMPWLNAAFLARGGILERRPALDLDREAESASALVLCAGLGARQLLEDRELYPSRGQLVLLGGVTLERFVLDVAPPGAPTYLVPRRDGVLAGGTSEDGVETLAIDRAAIQAIVERARALVPALAGAQVLRAYAGLRPCRPRVRLEGGVLPGGRPIVYNYGHGGSGFTVSWGTARAAADLVAQALG